LTTPAAVALFLGSLALTLAAAGFFADRLDHVGPRLGLPEAVVGLLTALAADAPELSSAVVALTRGEKDVSLGVVLGSNVFNLAAMVGLSALLAGAVTIGRRELAVEGFAALAATLVAGAVVIGLLPAAVACALFAAVAIPYIVAASRRPVFHHALPRVHDGALWKPIALIVPAVALIVLGSTGMVRSALVLSDRWDVSKVVVGIIVLAVLTSLPNAYTAVRLGLSGRGSALVSEAFGSNTINLVGGILVPALVVGLAGRSGITDFNLAWLAATTCVVVVLLARPRGMTRPGGALLVCLYAAFVAVQLAYG
jgi:cation:H+ antiporter